MKKMMACAVLSVAFLSFIMLSQSPQVKAGQDLSDALFLYVDSQTAMAYGEVCHIDEENKEVCPIVENGRTLVPVRFIAEKLGMSVEHLENPQQAVLTHGGVKISFFIGTNKFTVNGVEKIIDSENSEVISKVINGRTFVPLRALTDIIGKECYYDRGLIIVSDGEIRADKGQLDEIIEKINVLPTVGNAEFLLTLFDMNDNQYAEYDGAPVMAAGMSGGVLPAARESAMSESQSAAVNANKSGDFSQTNIQVEGVDEADVVKTDGDYIYAISNDKIIIAQINPVESMSVTKIIMDEKGNFQPYELFITQDKLIAIGHYYNYSPVVDDSAVNKSLYNRMPSMIRTVVYDITDRANPVQERTLDTSGNYVSSRRIGDIVYIISNEYMDFYYGMPNGIERLGEVAAIYGDSAVSNGSIEVGYDRLKYFPSSRSNRYMTIASIDITKPNQPAIVETILGGGENVYCSEENLFVATSKYGSGSSKTVVYKFSLNAGKITYLSKCEANGNILNQFSMDEYGGQFRIATTAYDYNNRYNNLYIYDDAMQPRGRIENIAPQERIYSVRFVGDRAYIVTFKDVDPLFVIDLSNIDSPKILGQLKIPGYSDYLHPVDANHIIGFGKDTAEQQMYYGNAGETTAFYQGMKMALFDVTDVTNPVQKYVEIIGGRGTDSDLLRNHKALLYMPDKDLLAFPITVYAKADNGNVTNYGEFEFNGAYVYDFNTENGFHLKGKITHYTNEDLLRFGYYSDFRKSIHRILYANGSLFTTSNSEIQAHNAGDITYLNKITME